MRIETVVRKVLKTERDVLERYRAIAKEDDDVVLAELNCDLMRHEIEQKESPSDSDLACLNKVEAMAMLVRDQRAIEYLCEDQKRQELKRDTHNILNMTWPAVFGEDINTRHKTAESAYLDVSVVKDWYYLLGRCNDGNWRCFLSSPVKDYLRLFANGTTSLSSQWEIWSNGEQVSWM